VARGGFDDKSYKQLLVNAVRDETEKAHINNMQIHFVKGSFTDPELFEQLRTVLLQCEGKGSCDHIYYLATSFKFFPKIIEELRKHKLHAQKAGFTRIVFEKPFGDGLSSSNNLDAAIHSVYDEDDVYRIDHYLAKNTSQNLATLKFLNPVIYGTFNNHFIEAVDVVVDENLGVGSRLEYYDEAGAMKDMVQNHLLQVLSLVLMERPQRLDPDHIHGEKLAVLKSLKVLPASHHVFGQYASYAKELKKKGLSSSKTETFANVELNCATRRWDGVRLTLRTGKMLQRKFGQIRIKYKPHSHFSHSLQGVSNNEIVLGIYPKNDVTIVMNSRDPHSFDRVKPVKFEFCYDCEFDPH